MEESELIKSEHCVLAVDPGKSGAVWKIGRGMFTGYRDFKENKEIALAIRDLAPGTTHGVIELVHAMPGQGVCSMFSFGRAAGVADAALWLCLPAGCAVVEVTPQKWQGFFREYFEISREEVFDSRVIAARLFPVMASAYLARKKDHNSADAILMAVWQLQQLAASSS